MTAMQQIRLALLRQLPSVDGLAQACHAGNGSGSSLPKLILAAARQVLDRKRGQVLAAATEAELTAIDLRHEALQAEVATWLMQTQQPHFRRVINATGVILHTNLGRALLSQAAITNVALLASHYSNLEYALERGQRGDRYVAVVGLLQRLTGAEDALVVNNNAAAVLLALQALAAGREVVV
jgi:L-seryl-tRNA(Ser) seleniumtransferase